jgi:aminopeptidase N
MREGPATVIRREDYAAPAYWIRSADLTFDLDPAKTIVASKLAIERNPTHPGQPLRLHGEGLNLLRVLADGESVSFRHEDGDAGDRQPAGADASRWRSATPARPRRTPSCRACTPAAAASSPSARPRASAASPTSWTGPT